MLMDTLDFIATQHTLCFNCLGYLETLILTLPEHDQFTELILNFSFSSNVEIDLSNNQISTVTDLESFNISYPATSLRNMKMSINLDDNPFNCDCKLRNFSVFLQDLPPIYSNDLNTISYPHFFISGRNLKCRTPKKLEDKPLSHVIQDLESYGIKTKNDINGSYDKPYVCVPCNCHYRALDEANVINCSNLNLENIPWSLPLGLHINHTELNFSGNLLRKVEIPNIHGYPRVTHLDLSHNRIEEVDIASLESHRDLFTLKKLDLSYNNLTSLKPTTIATFINNKELIFLALNNNPWGCDCEALPLIKYVKNQYNQVNREHNVTCSTGYLMESVDESKLCQTDGYVSQVLPVGMVFSVIITTIILICVYWRYRTAIQVYCYSSDWKILQLLVPDPNYDDTRKYDAFISYANEDEKFVIEELVPFLEEGENKFNLCLHYRDWIPGDPIPDQIVRSVVNSQRTIVVLSPNFLKSVWGILEFKTAHTEALEDGTSRVIIIVYQDVDSCVDINEDLKAYIKMNTYLKWGSKWFWKQLVYALRRSPQRAEQTSRSHELVKNVLFNNDEVEAM